MEEDCDAAAVSCSGSIAIWKKDTFVPGPNTLCKRPIKLIDLLGTTHGAGCRCGVSLADIRLCKKDSRQHTCDFGRYSSNRQKH